jgi:outer membrane protein TolC
MFSRSAAALLILLVLMAAGCTVHPQGEQQERQAALSAGQVFQKRIEDRAIPPLPDNPTSDDLVHYALLTNADLEQRFWEWRGAIEQIPQDGTQAANLALFGNVGIMNGGMSLDQTTLSAGNDPMADIVLPSKLGTAARRALENARAAGWRFRKAQYDLRNKVLSAYYDYALSAELIRLEQSNAELLKTTVMVVEARNRAGAAGQQDLLKARNELDLSRNDIANMQAQLPSERAALNALLSRPPDAALPVPTAMPAPAPLPGTDRDILALAARRNPELTALADEINGRKAGMTLAKLQYLPDFSVTVGSDLAGVGQSLAGMVTVPLLRYEAIRAAVEQAEANLRASEAMRRQAANDLGARVVMDLATVRDSDRQLELFDHTVLPRARQVVTVARSAYEAARASLLDLLDAQRSLIAIERLVANLHATREKRLADLEAIATVELPDREKKIPRSN